MTTRTRQQIRLGESGFTLIELLIVVAISSAVLGGTVVLAMQMQQGYSMRLEDVTVEEEARFTLDWIARTLRSAGSNPYTITTSACPVANTLFQAIRLDPNATGINDNVRVNADIAPPNGLLGGVGGACNEGGEDITIAHDTAASVITRRDHAIDAAPVPMTEPIFTGLLFTYLDAARNATTNANAIVYVQVQVTGQSLARNPNTGQFTTATLNTEVHLRTR